MNDTHMTMVGNVTDDPELRYTGNGIPWSTFRVASTPRRYDRAQDKWVDTQPVFMTVTVWRALALNVVASLRRGQPVVVTGRFQQREYEVNEVRRIAYAIEATAVGHDLSRGVTSFDKRTHSLSLAVATDDDGLPANEGVRFLPADDLAAASDGVPSGDPVAAFLDGGAGADAADGAGETPSEEFAWS